MDGRTTTSVSVASGWASHSGWRIDRRAVIALAAATFVALGAASGFSPLTDGSAVPAPPSAGEVERQAAAAYGQLPMRFEANRGQTAAQVRYLSRGPGYSLFLTPREAVLSLTKGAPGSKDAKTAVVRMGLIGANPRPELDGTGRLAGTTNYLKGNDAQEWRTGVSGFSQVRYRNTYPGIDLVFHGKQRRLEYDFVVAPGRSPDTIAVRFTGARKITLSRTGDLLLHTPSGTLRQHAPIAYQHINGHRRPVTSRYTLTAHGRVGFRIGAYDRTRSLTIDPVLTYSTYLGGVFRDRVTAISVDAAGSAYVTGRTGSDDFPVQNALQPNRNSALNDTGPCPSFEPCADAFVTKLSPDGRSLVYSTYLGGSRTDIPRGIVVDNRGRAAFTGSSASLDFPTTAGAFQRVRKGVSRSNAFVTVLNAGGTSLAYSTYLGGTATSSTADEIGNGIAVDSNRAVYVAGVAGTTDFPTAGAPFQATYGGDFNDGFVAKINPDLEGTSSLVYSTFLGGAVEDAANAIALDSARNAYVTGFSSSGNYPTVAAFQAASGGGRDAFVTKLNTTGSALLYSTYLGGSGRDEGRGIAVDATGSPHVAGLTASTNFPTQAPLQAAYGGGGTDGFVTKLVATGSPLSYSTYLGGGGNDDTRGIALDGAGGAYVTTMTSSTNLPTVDAIAGRGDQDEVHAARVQPDGSALSFASYLGGGGGDASVETAITVDGAGGAYVAGDTFSTDFPTIDPLQAANAGGGVPDGSDGFIAKISPAAAGRPLVTGLTAPGGSVAGGQTVTIAGTGLTGATSVRFGAVAAASFSVDSATQITAVTPPADPGAAVVTVTTPAGTSPANPIARFSYGQGTWRAGGALVVDRSGATATLLPSGRVLLTSGTTAELYDPLSETSTATGARTVSRNGATTTLLNTGKVLLAGSAGSTTPTELYDPATGLWANTAGRPTVRPNRTGHTTTLLVDGRVLLAGGNSTGGPSAELYDPIADLWTATSPLPTPRSGHTATRIGGPACAGSSSPSYCGRVLVVAGRDGNTSATVGSADVYNPADGTWSPTGALGSGREEHAAVLMADGRVLAAGGIANNRGLRTAEIYDPAVGTWSLTGLMAVPRIAPALTPLPDGRVLASGGVDTGSTTNSAEIYDPATGRWASAGRMVSYRGRGVRATVLSSSTTGFAGNAAICGTNCGKVLVTGGTGQLTSELYTAPPPPAGPGPGSPPQATPPGPTPPGPDPEPTAPGPAGPTTPSSRVRDIVRPSVTGLNVLDREFSIGSLLPLLARQSRVGTTIRFTLSEPATTRLAFARATSGRRVGTSCRRAARALRSRPRCTRYVAIRPGVAIRSAGAGANSVRFQGRLSPNRTLTPGRYRLTITATDTAGNRSRPQSTTFTLLPGTRPTPR